MKKIMYKLFKNTKTIYEVKPKHKRYQEIVTRTTEKGVYVLNGMSNDRFIPWNNVVPSSLLWIAIVVSIVLTTKIML